MAADDESIRVIAGLGRIALAWRTVANEEAPVAGVIGVKGETEQTSLVEHIIELHQTVSDVEKRLCQELPPGRDRPSTGERVARWSARLDSGSSKSVSTKYYIGPPLSGQAGRRSADPSDGVADGTESDGYTRRVRQTPFGAQHWWEKKQQ